MTGKEEYTTNFLIELELGDGATYVALRKQMNGIFCVLHQRMKRYHRVHFIRHGISRSRRVGSDCLQILWVRWVSQCVPDKPSGWLMLLARMPSRRPIGEPFHIPAEPKNCKPSQSRNLKPHITVENARQSFLHGREGPAIEAEVR